MLAQVIERSSKTNTDYIYKHEDVTLWDAFIVFIHSPILSNCLVGVAAL